MERLTGYDYIAGVKTGDLLLGVYPQKAFDRLAAYEDTGLEPEDIKRAFTEDTILKLAGAILSVVPDRLLELAQADQEGRCVVLPSGDYNDKDGENALKSAMNTCFYHNNPVTRYIADAVAEKLTREEAEAALSGEEK